ncbi:MAG: hypothetical protein Q4E76_02605 [Tissierellia bacterium]|nr:hypothetical protein [Tissierellia bacterium]
MNYRHEIREFLKNIAYVYCYGVVLDKVFGYPIKPSLHLGFAVLAGIAIYWYEHRKTTPETEVQG